jgi:hypothetical protein
LTDVSKRVQSWLIQITYAVARAIVAAIIDELKAPHHAEFVGGKFDPDELRRRVRDWTNDIRPTGGTDGDRGGREGAGVLPRPGDKEAGSK